MTAAGAVSGVTTLSADTNGATAGGTRLSLTDAAATLTSLGGNTVSTLNDTSYSVSHVDGTGTHSITVGATQQATIGVDTFSYGTTIVGGALVQGDLGVNGSIYALNPTANSGITVGNNGMRIDGAANRTSLVADSNGNRSDGGSEIIMQESQASMLVYNQQTGAAHGLTVNQTSTVLSGGTNSTTMTLNDAGATFANTTTGGPARVTGVADGSRRFDAVNYGQLKEAYGGIASVAAMANIPSPAPGKAYSIGLGFGNFEGENAFAIGGAARLTENVSLQASIGHSDDNNTVGAGVGFSW
jgi:trimeric autotransporter adhesin